MIFISHRKMLFLLLIALPTLASLGYFCYLQRQPKYWSHPLATLRFQQTKSIDVNFSEEIFDEDVVETYSFNDSQTGQQILYLELSKATGEDDFPSADTTAIPVSESTYLGALLGVKVYKIRDDSIYKDIYTDQLLFDQGNEVVDVEGVIGDNLLRGNSTNHSKNTQIMGKIQSK